MTASRTSPPPAVDHSFARAWSLSVVCELWQIAKDTNQQPQASIHNVIPADEQTSIEHRDGMETHRHHNVLPSPSSDGDFDSGRYRKKYCLRHQTTLGRRK